VSAEELVPVLDDCFMYASSGSVKVSVIVVVDVPSVAVRLTGAFGFNETAVA